MKLTKKQISRIKSLRAEGLSTYKIAKIMGAAQSTIYYRTIGDRDKLNKRRRRRYQKRTKEERKEISSKMRKYQREYRKKRYWGDKKFREELRARAREYKRKKKDEV